MVFISILQFRGTQPKRLLLSPGEMDSHVGERCGPVHEGDA